MRWHLKASPTPPEEGLKRFLILKFIMNSEKNIEKIPASNPPFEGQGGLMDNAALEEKVIKEIQTVFDPELPVNIWELGLIYKVEVLPINNVQILMTLTAPSCPAAQSLPVEVDQKVRAIEGVNDVLVTVTWDPPWDKSMMSEAAQLELGFM